MKKICKEYVKENKMTKEQMFVRYTNTTCL